MGAHPEFSARTLAVLAALREEPSRWRHGYGLARQTGLMSGTLYLILIQLTDRGLVERCWRYEPEPSWQSGPDGPSGRGQRHWYRLTPDGLAEAAEALAAAETLAVAETLLAMSKHVTRAGAGQVRG